MGINAEYMGETILSDMGDVKKGAKTFKTKCLACHNVPGPVSRPGTMQQRDALIVARGCRMPRTGLGQSSQVSSAEHQPQSMGFHILRQIRNQESRGRRRCVECDCPVYSPAGLDRPCKDF